ncbi:MAG: DUF2066 domain-containing protein [Chromatiaceae bacterium]|nr:DUF2066 domain-containing protein [Chromatiaceae bacterium]MCP5409019.1 DUF2066 domain-containing protein [Chromatiaceae bacterium]MCP5441910.1 DUF2066 domain-containing protein [Chromatiaceae bacterium]
MSAQVDGLYDAESPVSGGDASERNSAIRDAFAKVLVKLTGNSGIASRKALAADLENASHYVQQYRYEAAPAVGNEVQSGRLLQVSFDKNEINRLLQNRGLPIWSANRPSVLLWVGEEQQGKRRLLNPDMDTDVRAALDQVAAERGVPLLLPLMDLEDQGQMQVADIWGNFENNIRAASRRYASDLILTGRLVRVDKSLWRGEWRLYHADSQSNWNNEAASRNALTVDALQRTADSLANRFAPIKEERSLSTVRLRVSGIDSLEDYAAVLRLLGGQSSLERVVISSVEPNAVVYDLHGQGGVAVLDRELGIGGLIETDPGAAFQPDASAIPIDLYYRMR